MCQQMHDYESGSHYLQDCEDYKQATDQLMVIGDAMKRIVAGLYGNGELDAARIDDAIGEICDTLNLKMPPGLPRIRRQGNDLYEFAMSINQ